MAAWFLPALKAVLPHVGTLITAAAPVFTRKSADAANQAQLVQQQIAELQAAASQNADNIKALAEQLQVTVSALHQAAAIAETRLRRAYLLCIAAIGLSAVTLAVALFFIFAR
jgi:DNA-binding MarR family transcriptional regulator